MASQRKYYLHSRHLWTGRSSSEPEIQWSSENDSTRENSFLVEDIRDCLYLKLCGFVEAQKAQIVDVSSNHLRLQVGGTRLRSLFSPEACPLDLEIRLHPADAATESDSESARPAQAKVEVVIRDCRWRGETSRFEAAARRVLLHLRDHLMANQ